MSLSATQKTFRGLIAVAVVIFAIISSMVYNSWRMSALNASTLHTYQVICELKDTLSALQDVETGNRGYALTLMQNFLEPYENGIKSAKVHLDKLAQLLGEEPADGPALARLRQLADEKIAFSHSVIDAVMKGRSHGSDLVAQGKGKRIMDLFRAEAAVIADRKQKLLASKVASLEAANQLMSVVIAILAASSGALLLWVFNSSNKALKEEQLRVSALNEEIEQRKRIEKALKDATQRLVSSNTDLQQFAYVASHDLQEPLRAVSGFVQLLAAKNKANFDEESLVWINHAVEGSQRMRTLINDLLAYARIESRGKEFSPVDLNDVSSKVLHDLSVTIEETHAKVDIARLPTVSGDATQLGQLLQNLINNAIKFRSGADPLVKVASESKNQEYVISVKDNGRGFDMEHAERIFVIFQRLQGRTEAPGTGIGLAVCKKIVERHRGRIWVESKVGEGTTFFFTLPTTLESGEQKDDKH